MNAKNRKLLTVAGIGAAAVAAYYFIFRTRAGASVLNQASAAKDTIVRMFDLEPSYGTIEYKKFGNLMGRVQSIVEQAMARDVGTSNPVFGQDKVEFGTIVATRLMRNFKDLERANDNTIAQLARQDAAYQKMIKQHAATGKFWAGGSADIG